MDPARGYALKGHRSPRSACIARQFYETVEPSLFYNDMCRVLQFLVRVGLVQALIFDFMFHRYSYCDVVLLD